MLCRLCLYEIKQENMEALISNGEESNLIKLIAKYMHIEVVQTDDYSTSICKDCYQHLNDFHTFYQFVEQRQYALKNEINYIVMENVTPAGPIDAENNDMELLLDIKDVIAKEESSSDKTMSQIEFGFANDKDSNNLEAGNLSELNLKEDDLLLKPLKLKKVSSVKRNINKGRKGKESQNKLALKRTRKTIMKRSRRIMNRINRTSKTNAASNIDDVGSDGKNSVEVVKKRRKNFNTSEENKLIDDMIAKHIRLRCEICDTPVETFKKLQSHFREVHNTKAYITCCDKQFHRRFLLVDHIQRHLNPEQFKCELCNKVLKSKICMDIHYANQHSDKSALKHPCTLCDRRFAHTSNLAAHVLTHVKEKKHQCEICNKAFKSDRILKQHIRTKHEQPKTHICNYCGKSTNPSHLLNDTSPNMKVNGRDLQNNARFVENG